ncbi:uncharacterized protein TEOVI_000521500 [Trypanosoma equiperdum]|uniref:Uncharacterized protein n=1 Tax=Trypanosoma equiperdum TaxID=5694 RepID=A0A1G4I0M6_TRYEQ|nr:hypothetical protein, conserved [Trypanosoma equiperdum]
MFRVRRLAGFIQCSPCGKMGPLKQQTRRYTPIWKSDPAVDNVAPLRDEDERRTLWAEVGPISDVGSAVTAWIRFGNDPVLHTAVPTMLGGKFRNQQREKESLLPNSSSPFAYVEDYMGTNLVFGSPVHAKESAAVWATYFERRYASRLRLSRRTVANYVGLINSPEVFDDESDRPETRWSQDTFFRECAYLSEKFLKEKVSNMQQFEAALKRASPEAYLAFFDAFQQQTQTQIPLPSPSVWHYEGERRKQWAEKFISISHKAQAFFKDVLSEDVKKYQEVPGKLLQKVKPVLADVGKILVKRHERWLKGRVWTSLTEEEREAYCMKEVKRQQMQVEDGEFDPMMEDDVDDTELEEWQREHDAIMELMNSPIDGLHFTTLELWLHAMRCEELETEHIYTSARVRAVQVAARKKLYDTTSYEEVIQAVVESIARGTLDLGAGVLRPHFNEVWCQLNYAKFGSSTITQHTTTSRRQLLFFHAGSLKDIAATATLYYATKPLSNSLDYASPYKYRRSLITLCSNYGVETAYTTQRPLLRSAANLARAEDLIHAVVTAAAQPFGERRRAATRDLHMEFQRLAVPVERVIVANPVSALLESGADPDEKPVEGEKVNMWPLGAKRVVLYKWSAPNVEKLKAMESDAAPAVSGSSLTAERLREIQELKRRGFLEVSLWRRVTAQERKQRNEIVEAKKKQVEEVVRTVPSLAHLHQYATSLYSRIEERVAFPTETSTVTETTNMKEETNKPLEDSEWEFAVLLDDRVLLNKEESVELYLPYRDANGELLAQGEYRALVRAFDLEANPNLHPAYCSVGYSESFQVFDALPQLIAQFFRVKDATAEAAGVTHIPAADFTPFCAFLRDAGLDVPLRCEFEAGQAVTTDGDVYMDYFLQLLRGEAFHQSHAQAGLTEAQRAIEPLCRAHWVVHHPGADESEWATARRSVLDHAMQHEREWWFPNEMLDVKDVVTGSTNGLTPQMYPAAVRYGVELCTVLTAEGKFVDERGSGLSARCVVNGTGAAESVVFDTANCNGTNTTSVEDALRVAHGALRSAQDRHNTLAAFRLGPLSKQSQVLLFCGVNAYEFGGKYARTYAYAFEKAKKELEVTAASGFMAPSLSHEDIERLSDQPTTSPSVDRFASTTHPEQRKAQFVPRVGPGSTPLEDPAADQKSEWS